MSGNKMPDADASQENNFPQIHPELPKLAIARTMWTGVILEHHRQPPFETPEYSMSHNLIGLNVGQSFHMEQKIDGRWHSGQVFPGAIGIFPFNISSILRWHSEMNVISFNIKHELLVRHASELFNTEKVELLRHLSFEDPLIYQIGITINNEWQFNRIGSRIYAETMANALAVYLLRYYSNKGHKTIKYKGGICQHKLRLLKDYINDYLDREISLDELAAIAQLSPYHFSRAFKQSTGMSPHQYVIKQRVERAKLLLLQGKMRLSEIAIACGFSHQSHLNRHFKRLTGVIPKTLLKS
jgi:AraC family transcriptional regulator